MSKRLDITGERSGRLVALYYDHSDKYGKAVWMCQCDCGRFTKVLASSIRGKHIQSCGCSQKEHITKLDKDRKKYNDYAFCGDIVFGKLSNSEDSFIVDRDDYEKIKDCYWYLDSDGYVKGHDPRVNKTVKLHKIICGESRVDHKDRNKLNNKKDNLRGCTQQENVINRSIGKNNKTGFVGITKRENKWIANITYGGKQHYLGIFDDINDAIVARLKAECEHFGEYAPQRHLFQKYDIAEDLEDAKDEAGV